MLSRRTGTALMILALIANPRTVGRAMSPDGSIDAGASFALILAFDIILFGIGLMACLRPDWWVRLEQASNVRSVFGHPAYLYPVFFSSTALALAFAGGSLVLLLEHTPTPFAAPVARPLTSALLALVLGYVAWSSALVLSKADRKTFVFSNILFAAIVLVSLYATNLAVSFFIPPWPARGLHGIDPAAGRESWAKAALGPESVGNNSWGQRDRERELWPASGVRRVAFIGDSFLEEGTSIPVSVRVEDRLAQADIEVINLGVSATAPDEYFYRLKNIAIPLGIEHCVFFVFSNDFVQSPTIPSYFGVLAPHPRGSLLESMGLRALNHVLMNQLRPVLRHWGDAGELWERHERWFTTIRQASDEGMIDALAGMLTEPYGDKLRRALAGKDLSEFIGVLRQPDKNTFRIYYVEYALWAAAKGAPKRSPVSIDHAYHWVEASHRLCVSRNIGFTLVMIPTSFQVDPRVQAQFQAVVDMKAQTRPARDAAEQFLSRARADGIETLDLSDALSGEPGTYLNLDGHWSDHGAALAAAAVAEHLDGLR